ncbi:LysR family transcriptional regulator [Asanoa ishikariensis]|uniref:DNA-binding transcriptional regulator, LysR family n=1 Tax=Asanoa ishikariensis TaxID=137265 RepID=A0A1H3TE32_9ACTN|nr:LysR family transcriptional regulator [Asanoa ishikariensis]GIF62665.1 LysR family transcriptional regulator [Asanoa ishikariensis]SDZ48091.1 DNA-binding transcriptional regulator, LysR family [Asanoa ishikariensis]
MTPDLRQFRYFVAVAEESSFTRAATRLMIAQQSLSQQITALERNLGVKLFERDSRGTRLTETGTLFLPEARAALARADEAVAVVQRARRGEVGELRLAFLATTANHLLPPIVRAARSHLPEVSVLTTETTIGPLVDGMLDGSYDLAFTRPPQVPGLATHTIATEQVCAVLPAGHPLADRASLALADLAGERWVMTPRSSWEPWHRAFDESFRAAGFTPEVVARDASVQGLLGLVAAGVGVTRLGWSAHHLRRTGVVFVPLTGELMPTDMVWRPDNTAPALRRLREVVTDLAASTDLTEAG